jgi:hypothetical protein
LVDGLRRPQEHRVSGGVKGGEAITQ